jgi:type IV secretory pathway VirJ component
MRILFIFIALCILTTEVTNASSVDSLLYGNFGKVFIYKPKGIPDAVVLFVSGDGGWNQGPINMGNHLVDKGAMVVGINISKYLTNKMQQHEKCYYPAGDFEELSLYIQKKYKFRNYLKPILMGYSSGATLVYGILAQAPANTFKGAISMGFCPDIPTVEPLCTTNELRQHPSKPGSVIWLLEPSDKLTAPFIVINGIDDKVCDFKKTKLFMDKINNGEYIGVPKAGHGMSVQKNYLPHLLHAYDKIKKSASYSEMVSVKNKSTAMQQPQKLATELPLIVLPPNRNDSLPLLVFISGKGGWTNFEQGIAENLVKKGFPVIGIDAQKYFWQPRTPDETAAELVKVIHHFLAAWNKKSFVLCGYSFGADVIPFMVTRLPYDLAYTMKRSVMMSPDPKTDFEIHAAEALSFYSRNDKYNVLAEVKKSSPGHMTCIFGKDEEHEPKIGFENAGAIVRLLPGNHHYDNDFNVISNEIISSIRKK